MAPASFQSAAGPARAREHEAKVIDLPKVTEKEKL